MYRVLAGALLLAAMIGAFSMSSRAARDVTTPLPAGARELVVFETDNCIYCGLMRRDVLPDYMKSQRAAEVPIRFVNVSHATPPEASLAEPLTVVPTIVLMDDGREVSRITGYAGPENFFHMVSHMLSRN